MSNYFTKKIYTSKLFFGDIKFLLSHFSQIRKARKNPEISKAFIEKIMTVTTAVNGCRYCTWFHAKQAVLSGISKEEVKNMLNLQFQADANEFEIPGLLYAQHYAETDRKPEKEMTEKFYEFYGKTTADDIYLYMRMIFFGNLSGNTWDAVLSRLKGKPAEGSNWLFEIFFFIFNFPAMLPIMIAMKNDEKKKQNPKESF